LRKSYRLKYSVFFMTFFLFACVLSFHATITWADVNAPAINPNGGSFVDSVNVSIENSTGFAVFYTTDGSTPTADSNEYLAPFTLTTSETVQAAVYDAAEGLWSDIASATFTITPSGDEVYFNDTNLENAVRSALGKPTDYITKADMAGLTDLSAENLGISDLTGLKYASNLQKLILYSNQISDISALANLVNLDYLNLSNNQISDISVLTNLNNLRYLDLQNNQINDISALTNLNNLQELYLSNNQISDITPLITNSWSGGLGQWDTISLELNYLDLASGSKALTDVQTLISNGVKVSYEPQNTTSSTNPKVVSLVPAQDDANVAVDAAVSAVFDLDVSVVDLSGVTIKDSNNNTVTGVSANLGSDNKTLTIAHDNFANGTTYTVEIPANSVQSIFFGTGNEAMNWSFTTAAKPVPVSNSPLGASVAVDAAVSVVFDMDVNAVDCSWIVITDSSGNPVGGIGVTLESDNRTLSITHGNLAENCTYTVTIPAGSVQSMATGTNNDEISWSFTTAVSGSTQTGTFAGKVYDAVTGAPIEGVNIECYLEYGGYYYDGVTGSDGSYQTDWLPSGRYQIIASKDGYYQRNIYWIPTGSGVTLTENIALTPTYMSVGTISGYVASALNGSGLNGARVALNDGMNCYTYGNGSNGYYYIDNVPADKIYTVTANLADYKSRSVGGVKTGETADFTLTPEWIGAGTVSGKVYNTTGSAGIAGAKVSAGFGLEAVSDASGNYTLNNLPEGVYYLQAYLSGYECDTAQVSVTSGGSVTKDFGLTPGVGAGSVYGYVQDISSRSYLNGALVSVGGKTVMTQRRPGGNEWEYGWYNLQGLRAGSYTLEAGRSGYYTRSNNAVTVERQSVSYGSNSQVNMALTSAYCTRVTLTGTVKNAVTGNPLAGVSVWVNDGVGVMTDSAGNYTITDLPVGNYNLSASKQGYSDRTLSNIMVSGQDGTTVTQDIALTPTNVAVSSIYGYVVNIIDGSGLSGARVELSNGLVNYTYNMNGNGYYYFDNLPVNQSYTITVSLAGYKSRSVDGMAVGGGALDFALTPTWVSTGSISGKVYNTAGADGIAEAWVGAGFGLWACTDASGNYTIDNLPAGDYNLQAGYLNGYESDTALVNVTGGSSIIQDFGLTPAAAGLVCGYVRDISSGQGLNGVVVSIGGKTVITQRKPGSYEWDNGWYEVYFVPVGNYTLEACLNDYYTRSTNTVKVSYGGSSQVNIALTSVYTPWVTLTGVVKNVVTGKPLAGATVWVANGVSVLTDSAGNYTITDLPAGNYSLSASSQGYFDRTFSGIPLGGEDGTTVTQNIALTPNNVGVGNISGYVVSALDGRGLDGARVELGDGLAIYTYCMNSSGYYSFSDIPVSGSYTITATLDGYKSRSVEGIVAGDTMDFALAPDWVGVGQISGMVYNTTGYAGIGGARVSAGFGFEAITDASGNYTIEDLPDGLYYLQAYRSGYDCDTAQVGIASGSIIVKDFSLAPDVSAGSVYGRVWNSEYWYGWNYEINGAVVSIGGKTVVTQRRPGSYEGDNGWYQVQGLRPISHGYQLVAATPGCQVAYYSVSVPAAGSVSNDVGLMNWGNANLVVVSTDPADGKTKVQGDSNISVNFNDYVYEGTAFNNITLKDAAGNVISANKSVNGSTVLAITPAVALADGVYTVIVPVDAVKLADGTTLASDYSFSFTVGTHAQARPQLAGKSPSGTGVAVDAPVTAVFDVEVAAEDLSGVVIKDDSGYVADGVVATLGSDKKTLTIAYGELASSTVYTVVIPAGSLRSSAYNTCNESISWNFTTAPDTNPPGEVSNLNVTQEEGAGCFNVAFTAPADRDLQGVTVYSAAYGSDNWKQASFTDTTDLILSCQPGQAVETVICTNSLVLGSDSGAQIKVVAVDRSGNRSQGVVADNGSQGYPVLVYRHLKPGPAGWTTFSVPVRTAGQKIFSDIFNPDDVEIAYKFDAVNQIWVQVLANDSLSPLDAIYVKLKAPTLAKIKPSMSPTNPPVKSLAAGWNLIGLTDNRDLASALYSVRDKWSIAVNPSVNSSATNEAWAITPGQNAQVSTHYGYWVYMDSAGKLAGFSSTPVTVGNYPVAAN